MRDEAKEPLVHEALLTRVYRFGRALVVGSGATLLDFSVFTTCVRAASVARVPALLVGASVQFFGNRSFTFRAKAGSLSGQAKLFLLAESITLALNWSVFHFLERSTTSIAPELLSFAGTFVVFIGFAYPVRRLIVFRLPR